jgi:hypothetical protein
VLALKCFLRIGVSLTYGILCSIGAGVGIVTPMILKASGQFAAAPDVMSTAGLTVLAGLAILLLGVCLASLAGFGREAALKASSDQFPSSPASQGSFAVGLTMAATAGVLSAGWGLAFAYGQGPIIASLTAHGAKQFPASIGVWAFALSGAALVNTLHPALLLTNERSWSLLLRHPRELALALTYGALFFVPSTLLGVGMLKLGSLGASVGFGVVQGTLILGGQFLGFWSEEWRNVAGGPRRLIYAAMLVLMFAVCVLAMANAMVPSSSAR